MAYKLFINTNVYLDFLQHRGGDWKNAKAIFELAENNLIEIHTSSISLINIIYILDTYKLEKHKIIENIFAILSFTKLINPDNITFEIALASGFKDLEDAVQYHTALEINGINYFITSNIKDYKNSLHLLEVIAPGQFIERYKDDK